MSQPELRWPYGKQMATGRSSLRDYFSRRNRPLILERILAQNLNRPSFNLQNGRLERRRCAASARVSRSQCDAESGMMIDLERCGRRLMMWKRVPPGDFVSTIWNPFDYMETITAFDGWEWWRLLFWTLWNPSSSISGAEGPASQRCHNRLSENRLRHLESS